MGRPDDPTSARSDRRFEMPVPCGLEVDEGEGLPGEGAQYLLPGRRVVRTLPAFSPGSKRRDQRERRREQFGDPSPFVRRPPIEANLGEVGAGGPGFVRLPAGILHRAGRKRDDELGLDGAHRSSIVSSTAWPK